MKPAAVAKPINTAVAPANRTQPVTLTKSKKVLTVDSMNDLEPSSEKQLLSEGRDEVFEGEVLLLNQENIAKLWTDYAGTIPEEKRGLIINFNTFSPELDSATLSKLTL